MTWETLQRLLKALPKGNEVLLSDPAAALRSCEEQADAAPRNRGWQAAVRALHGAVRAADGLNVEVCGVRRERLLRWDHWTTTWVGIEIATGGEGVVRALRPSAAADPILRRAIARDGRALSGLVPDLRITDGALAAPLPGTALAADPGAPTSRLVRLLGTALGSLASWEAAGMHPLGDLEHWRETESGLILVVLEASHATDMGPRISELASALLSDTDAAGAIEALVAGMTLAPPQAACDAAKALNQAMATDLAGRRHDVFQRSRAAAHGDRAARLLDAVNRLQHAFPPPDGRGAIGVDLNGLTTLIHLSQSMLMWGPAGGDQMRVWSPADGFDAPEARRLLRARASAPSNERLQAEVGGSSDYTAAIGRWVFAGLKARTIRLLLEKELSRQQPAMPTNES